eukprot:TRINITY_DN12811_c0_g1_i2.p1 TRINITY_DN12811_c0_g1~~TRINITY_DN12811_c0_g1_i2.p1  ORF type:complete len:234 (+),score=68.21 TRINITY_DN12811_c0_g1_i2:108-704(+)
MSGTEMPEGEEFDQGMRMGEEGEDNDIEQLRAKVAEMEAQLKEETDTLEAQKDSSEGANDDASVYIGQVDYSATPEELHSHFAECGVVKRVTILCDKWTGHPKGYAYMEFEEPSSVEKAVQLNESSFKGRNLKVLPKRANQPGHGKKGAKGGKGSFKGYKGSWWDTYSAGYSPYAASAGSKGKKGKKAPWYASGKGSK